MKLPVENCVITIELTKPFFFFFCLSIMTFDYGCQLMGATLKYFNKASFSLEKQAAFFIFVRAVYLFSNHDSQKY